LRIGPMPDTIRSPACRLLTRRRSSAVVAPIEWREVGRPSRSSPIDRPRDATMKPLMRIPRRLVPAISVAMVLVAAWAAPRPGAGQGGGARVDDLLAATPFDRITLADGTVLEVEPISPRPLPAYDPKKD